MTLSTQKENPPRQRRLIWGLIMAVIVLILSFSVCLTVGTTNISLEAIWQALVAFDGSTEHWIVRSIRLPVAMMAV
ncbi:MAG: hypothetical protein SAJ12_23435, partial [Jaaginema sp. PMC 1079.18]|nr:hypothetical protein [Jaaginema sp. PMC 1079.18]